MHLDENEIIEVREYETDDRGRLNLGLDRANTRVKVALLKVIQDE